MLQHRALAWVAGERPRDVGLVCRQPHVLGQAVVRLAAGERAARSLRLSPSVALVVAGAVHRGPSPTPLEGFGLRGSSWSGRDVCRQRSVPATHSNAGFLQGGDAAWRRARVCRWREKYVPPTTSPGAPRLGRLMGLLGSMCP